MGHSAPVPSVALACAQREPSLAVIAKSAVGRLWDLSERGSYKVLFNPSTSAYRLWACVEVARAVELQLEERRGKLQGRARSVAVQGSRIALHLVFRGLDMAQVDHREDAWQEQLESVPAATDVLLDLMIEHVEAEYATNYIEPFQECLPVLDASRARARRPPKQLAAESSPHA
jgi:hypothetical protein